MGNFVELFLVYIVYTVYIYTIKNNNAMKTNGKWTVTYVRSNEVEDVFKVEKNSVINDLTDPVTPHYEYRQRDTSTEQDILDSLPD